MKSLFILIVVNTLLHIKKLVAAYHSIRNNLPYLFYLQNYKKLNLSNTTNLIEGGVFSPLKILIKYIEVYLKV